MNKKKEIDQLSQFISEKCNLLLLFPHYEYDHLLIEENNPEIFSTEIFRVIQFKVGMN